ncbi:WxL protein peptidoglycan domain-containing protein [Streptomyces sp. NPDC002889]|uniref:WxL protein peptidoglycan domain-containing protein n=1 Tax=Streptomyces sp. NPDC002889 TaxID=3364669 RepID=UPI0036BC66F8
MRKLYAILLPVLVAFLHTYGPAPAAHAADNGSWSVFPTASALGTRPYFYLSADPGATLTDQVTVTNKTAAPLTFRLYAADAYNTERDGGFAVRTEKEKQRGVGAWARPERDRVTVPAHGSVTVPYTLAVPGSAEPGDHAGALVALDERVAPTRGSVAVGVRQAVGARVYLRVNGPAVPALSVEDVSIRHEQPLVPGTGESSALISYTLHNRGNVTLNPRVALKAEGLFGRDLLARNLEGIPSELLPRQKIRLTERWADAPRLEWGEITLTASARDVRESAGASFFALPWLVVAVLAAGLVAAGVWARVRRGQTRVTEAVRHQGQWAP